MYFASDLMLAFAAFGAEGSTCQTSCLSHLVMAPSVHEPEKSLVSVVTSYTVTSTSAPTWLMEAELQAGLYLLWIGVAWASLSANSDGRIAGDVTTQSQTSQLGVPT